MKTSLLLIAISLYNIGFAQKIDRKKLVQKHSVINTVADTLSSLSVGNGDFAFTVDVTGLQTFPKAYAKGVPLGTQSSWGWHSFIDTANFKFEETLKNYDLNGRKVSYAVQIKEPEHAKNAVNWFRQNPHRLQLGNLGFEIIKNDGSIATLNDIKNIHQTLNVWKGEIESTFTIENEKVRVISYCHQSKDVIAVKVYSNLINQQKIKLTLTFPYPTGDWTDVGTNYTHSNQHSSSFKSSNAAVLFQHQLDTTKYFVKMQLQQFIVKEKQPHSFTITPLAKDSFSCTTLFSPTFFKNESKNISFNEVAQNSQLKWKQFWQSGAAIDFTGSTHSQAFELERRIILSQYLTKIQCTSAFPPQETGLTYNSWYGKPHLEMHWWHGLHFALWGRIELLEKTLGWYKDVQANAKKIAVRQGYDGVRWQKMTDHAGNESPSSVGAFLIWQQPHIITFTQACYKAKPTIKTLTLYKDLVFETANFMASYAHFDSTKQKYILGKGVIAAQERFKAEETFNPTYELAYWYWALQTAIHWKQLLHLPIPKKWNHVLENLSPLPTENKRYLFAESATDSYTNPVYRTDHPAVLGAFGMLPATKMIDTNFMKNTFDWIWTNWDWNDTWGWDFPLTAMTATKLHLPEKAVEALLMPIRTNTYLNNGHNYQDKRLTIYLPGNGGLLAAIAMMCTENQQQKTWNTAFPNNGSWKVKTEGFKKIY